MENEVQEKKGLFVGRVIRVSSEKTLSVEVVSYKLHPKYRKKYKDTKHYLVHNEKEQVNVGDMISFASCRPRSKRKRFEIIAIQK